MKMESIGDIFAQELIDSTEDVMKIVHQLDDVLMKHHKCQRAIDHLFELKYGDSE